MKSYIGIGSSKKQVRELLGEPSRSDVNFWTYGTSHIKFSSSGFVVAWKNMFGELSKAFQPYIPTEEKLSLGQSKAQVIEVLGAPTAIIDAIPEEWKYEGAHVKFDKNDKVCEWKNVYDQISYGLLQAEDSDDYIDIGTSKEKVLKILGAPSMISALDHDTWYYQASHVKFKHNKVIEWKNQYDQLSFGMKKAEVVNGHLFIGASKHDVLTLLGSPTSVLSSNSNVWKYESSHILFENDRVIEWKSMFGQLNHGLKKAQGGVIRLGMHKDQILEILGSPDTVSKLNKDLWHYKSSHVFFIKDKLVEYRAGFHDFDIGLKRGSSHASDIDIGSSEEEVLERLGSPTAIFYRETGVWHYGNASVYFDNYMKVRSWQNIDDIKKKIKLEE